MKSKRKSHHFSMHELSLTQNIVEMVAQQAQGLPVKKVTLEIGQLSAILPDSIRFCFDICCRGTLLEGAILDIQEVEGIGRCRHCHHSFRLTEPFGICDRCGSVNLEIIQGQELKIQGMEVESLCA